MISIITERGSEHDLEAIFSLDAVMIGNQERHQYLARALQSQHCWVVNIDNSLAGFVVLAPSFFQQPFIELLFVHPAHRRQGIGTMLIRHCESIGMTEKLFTSTNESNIPMQQLLAAVGFERCGYVEHLDEGDPEIIYYKRLEARLL